MSGINSEHCSLAALVHCPSCPGCSAECLAGGIGAWSPIAYRVPTASRSKAPETDHLSCSWRNVLHDGPMGMLVAVNHSAAVNRIGTLFALDRIPTVGRTLHGMAERGHDAR